MNVNKPDTEDLTWQRRTLPSVSRLTDILCQYFTTVLLIWVALQPHSHKINEQLVFAKMNLPDHTVPLVLWICPNFKASAIVRLLDHPFFTNIRPTQRWCQHWPLKGFQSLLHMLTRVNSEAEWKSFVSLLIQSKQTPVRQKGKIRH